MRDVIDSYFTTQRLAWRKWAIVFVIVLDDGSKVINAEDLAKSKRLAKKMIVKMDHSYDK